MTNIIYDPIQDEDPIDMHETVDDDEDDPEEKEELIRMIMLAQYLIEYSEVNVRYNDHFARHLKLTYFLKHAGNHLRQISLVENICPSFLKKIAY